MKLAAQDRSQLRIIAVLLTALIIELSLSSSRLLLRRSHLLVERLFSSHNSTYVQVCSHSVLPHQHLRHPPIREFAIDSSVILQFHLTPPISARLLHLRDALSLFGMSSGTVHEVIIFSLLLQRSLDLSQFASDSSSINLSIFGNAIL